MTCPPDARTSDAAFRSLLDRDAMHALGLLVPMRFEPVQVLPGRHPLGRAGDGMRLLRIRPYEPGEDNPRDIDKFSPPHDRRVIEWENEARATVRLLADNSASMGTPHKWALRNACLLQLTYSFWRAGDSVGTALFDERLGPEVRSANLRTQMQRLTSMLIDAPPTGKTHLGRAVQRHLQASPRPAAQLTFLVSDFVGSNGESTAGGGDWRELSRLFRRNLVPIVISFVVHPDTEGMIKVRDPETGLRCLVRFSGSRVRRINDEEKARIAVLAREFRTAGLDHIVVTQQREIWPALSGFARARRRT